jgi:hypothetical protein
MDKSTNKTRTLSDQIDAAVPRPATTGRAGRTIGGCFALAAFAVAVISGLGAGNAASLVLLRAILAMLVCYPVGLLIGMICTHVVDSHLRDQLSDDDEPQHAGDDNNAGGTTERQRADSGGEPAHAV